MAFDFPASPTSGQQFAPSGGPTYEWNGFAWVKKTTGQGIGAVAVASDMPPSSPAHGQLWYETDSGLLFMYYNDGNTAQWVQVSAPASGLLDAPVDGKEYVRVNGIWRMTKETVDLAGATQGAPKIVSVPLWAKFFRLTGEVWQAQSGFLNMQYSIDGTTWVNGASDYQTGGFVHNTGSSGYANYVISGTSAYILTLSGDNLLLSQSFNVRGSVGARGTTGGVYGAIDIESSVFDAQATTQMRHFVARGYINVAVAPTVRVQMLRFFPSYSPAGFVAGSQMTVEWS
jgi:hypothetical protein